MPEGPEIKIITNWLNKYYSFSTILQCSTFYKKRTGFQEMIGSIIESIHCKGKQIFFKLRKQNGNYIYLNSRLALEGKWSNEKNNHTKFWIIVEKSYISLSNLNINKITQILYFNDSRNFGDLELLNFDQFITKIKRIGPDLLSDIITYEEYYNTITKFNIKNKQICEFLMNQHFFSGIGNYLKAEILYTSHIRPDRLLYTLTDNDIYKLYINSITIIKQSFIYGGLTIKSFWSPDGSKENFPINIYKKIKDNYGNSVEKIKLKDKRTTYWVPSIQI